jgi:hypothetical protein
MQPFKFAALAQQLCQHALWRQAQRAFPDELIDLLLLFARPTPAGGGRLRYRFDDETWAEAAEWLGKRALQFERYRKKAYLIEDRSGTIVTVAWEH